MVHNQSMMASQTVLQRTPLYDTHAAHGGKLVEFGGWEMPLQFGKVLDEHHAVRKACGLFDISHMGVLSVHSGDVNATRDALNYLIPQDLIKTYPGKAVYTQLLNPTGGVIDDIIVYWMAGYSAFPEFTEFMVICNAANTPKVLDWFKQNLPTSLSVEWLNRKYSLLALQGPRFREVLAGLGLPADATLPKRFHIGDYQLNNTPVLLSRTGYTGEDGVEILVSSEVVAALWKQLLVAGESVGLKPVGLAARDTLRLEAAYPLHGAELAEDISPLEAGLEWSVKLDQAEDFIGKAALLAQQQAGLTRHFVCFEVLKKAIPRHHDILYDREGHPMGTVTSGSISPTLDKPIGVGYFTCPQPPAPGTPIKVGIRSNMVDAAIVERPFYRK